LKYYLLKRKEKKMSEGAGKGDTYRKVSQKYYEEYERIFGKKPLNNREENEDEKEGNKT